MSGIRENLLRVRERIEKAAQKAGRDPKDIRLVAVSKTVETDRIKEAIEAGVTVLGENYVQEAQKKIEELGKSVSWHFIGHLQSNKAKIDLAWLDDVVRELDRLSPGVETELLAARLSEMQGRLTPQAALQVYGRIADRIADSAAQRGFTWNGIKDPARFDSFFDPFGNLTLAQRAKLEMARLHHAAGRAAQADAIRVALRVELGTPSSRRSSMPTGFNTSR